MRILIFMTQFYRLGGAERLAVELAEELNSRGIRADILSMYTEDLPGVKEAKESILGRGVPAVHFLEMRVNPKPTEILPAIRRLRTLISENRYDIVETSLASPAILAAWGTIWSGARHVAGIHQVFLRERDSTWQNLILKFSARLNRRIRCYAISRYAADHWVTFSRISGSRVRRIFNGISGEYFAPRAPRDEVRRKNGIPQDAKVVIYVGRLAAYKGIDTLFEACIPILESRDIVLLYVGTPDLSIAGTDRMLREIESRAESASWGKRVRFLGFRKDVPDLMASADVLAHPTRTEGFGLSLVEALAVGLPVVASNVEAIPEILDGTHSILVEPDDPAALRRAIAEILERGPEESDLAARLGRIRARRFDAATRAEAMSKLFADVHSGEF